MWLKKLTKSALFIIILGILGACSSTKVHQPHLISEYYHNVTVDIPWDIHTLSASIAGSFVPVLDNNAIFTADSAGDVFRVDDSDGTIISRFKLGRKLSSGTAVSANSIFVTTQDGYLLSVSKATGEINWQAQLPTISIEAPQVGGEIVVVKSNDTTISAYDSKNGALLWVYQKTTPALMLRSYDTFQVIGRDVIILGEPGGRLALLNLNNGMLLWENDLAKPKGSTDLDKITDIGMRPVLKEKTICVATYNGKLSCIDALNSKVLWSRDFSANLGLLIGEQNLYIISTDGTLFAFDKATGVKIWQNNILQYRELSMPIFYGDKILIIENSGILDFFDKHNGHLVSRNKSNIKNGVAYPIVDSAKIIVQSGNGHLAKINVN